MTITSPADTRTPTPTRHDAPRMTESANHPGLLLIISGPSGVGKTTITHHVEQALDATFSVSLTTRPKTEKDIEGEDYQFVTREAFDAAVARNELLEWAEVFGNCYGTPRAPVEAALRQGKLVILEIDVQGAEQVKQNLPQAFAMFVLPPSERVLLERLRKRQREDEAIIQRRFAKAKHEIIRAWESGVYDEFIVNRDLNHAVHEAATLVSNELQSRKA